MSDRDVGSLGQIRKYKDDRKWLIAERCRAAWIRMMTPDSVWAVGGSRQWAVLAVGSWFTPHAHLFGV